MKKIIRTFFKNNIWVIIALVDIATLLVLFYIAFGFLWETAQFHAAMNSLAG